MFIDSTANGYRVAPLPALQANFALSKASSIRCLHPPRLRYLCWLVSTSIACKIKSIQTAAAPFRIRGLGLRVDPLIHFLLQQVLEEIKRPRISGAISAGSCSFRIAPALSPTQDALTPPHVALGFDAFARRLHGLAFRGRPCRGPVAVGCPPAAALLCHGKATCEGIQANWMPVGSRSQSDGGFRAASWLERPEEARLPPSSVALQATAVALRSLRCCRSFPAE